MGKPHVHAKLINAWADGAEIEWLSSEGWQAVKNPSWEIRIKYRIKPEREYPKTTLKYAQLQHIFMTAPGNDSGSYFAIANAAIKQYIIEQEAENG